MSMRTTYINRMCAANNNRDSFLFGGIFPHNRRHYCHHARQKSSPPSKFKETQLSSRRAITESIHHCQTTNSWMHYTPPSGALCLHVSCWHRTNNYIPLESRTHRPNSWMVFECDIFQSLFQFKSSKQFMCACDRDGCFHDMAQPSTSTRNTSSVSSSLYLVYDWSQSASVTPFALSIRSQTSKRRYIFFSSSTVILWLCPTSSGNSNKIN